MITALRWITRDGQKVLQWTDYNVVLFRALNNPQGIKWQDVPTIEEEQDAE